MLEGRHGTAKTTMVTKVFSEAFGEDGWLYLSGATIDPWIDFVGVPREERNDNGDAVLDFILPRRLVDCDVKAIFIDEYNRSHKKVRNATMELIQFKSINGKKFPNLKVVWAAVNPFTDEEMDNAYDVENIDAAQKDRFQIQIKLPYQPDFRYFANKFGEEWAKASIEWWNDLDAEIKYQISPRRLDYALEIAQIGGAVEDVLPLESNPIKLSATLAYGNIEDKLNSILKEGDYAKARDFINVENHYQCAKEFLEKKMEFRRFFLPLLDSEKLAAIFFEKSKVKEFVLKNPLFFVNTLQAIVDANTADGITISSIKRSLKSVEGMTTFVEGGN